VTQPPTNTPTATATLTETATPTATSTATPTQTPTATASFSPIATSTSSSTPTATITPSGPTIRATPLINIVGGTETASWSGIANPTATDWIGLYHPGASNFAYIDWRYVNCTQRATTPRASGSCNFVIGAAGTYEFRLFANNRFTRLAVSNQFTVLGAPAPTLQASPAAITAGGTDTASWSGITNPTANDWVGLYHPGDSDYGYLDWLYVSCAQAPSSPRASGSCNFVVASTGTYEFRLFANNSVTRLAVSNPLTVT
jgi:hypothetical protein